MFSDPIVKIILSSTNVELPKLFAKKNVTTGFHGLKIKKRVEYQPFSVVGPPPDSYRD